MVIKAIKRFFQNQIKKREEKLRGQGQVESFRETEEMKKAEEIKREADRLAQLKQYKVAIDEYNKALELYPFKGSEPEIFKNAAEFLFKCNYNIAACYSYLDNFDKSIGSFEKALTIEMADDENKVRALMGKGSCLYRKRLVIDGRYRAGAYNLGMEEEPHIDEKIIHEYKEQDKKKSLLKQAHESFAKATELNKAHVEAWYDKGHMEFLMGSIKEAVQSFDSVINIDKGFENKESISLFDEVKRDRGVPIKATELIERSEYAEPTFKTKTGHLVKTRAEMMIANFLFDNNLLFQYCAVATWADKDDFRPSFYIPKLDLYVDHYPYDYIKEYQKLMRAKIKQYEKHKKKHVFITSEDEKNIEESLRLKMKPYVII